MLHVSELSSFSWVLEEAWGYTVFICSLLGFLSIVNPSCYQTLLTQVSFLSSVSVFRFARVQKGKKSEDFSTLLYHMVSL